MTVLYLIACGFVCSFCTAAIGAGGGVLLFPLLHGSIPTQALNPVHGLVQMAGNAYRLILRRKEIKWRVVAEFGLGCACGSILAAYLPAELPEKALLITFGTLLILNIVLSELMKGRGCLRSLFLAGAVQGLLSPYIGVLGGVTSSALLSLKLSHASRATHIAATGLLLNGSKSLVFVMWGVDFTELLPYVMILVGSSLLGTWVGIHHSEKISERTGSRALKVIVILAGAKMIVSGLGLL